MTKYEMITDRPENVNEKIELMKRREDIEVVNVIENIQGGFYTSAVVEYIERN